MSIYNHKESLESLEDRIRNATYSEKNRQLLLRYEDYLFAEGLSDARILKYMGQLNRIASKFNTDFDTATKDDITGIVAKIERQDYTTNTKNGYKICIKKFYRWIYGMYDGENPDITKWIKTKPVRDSPVQKEDLITQDEVTKMIKAAAHPRDKALIALLYDSGGRIGEIANAKIKDIHFDKNGARIFLDGKTGKRTIRIIMSTSYLASWLSIHPQLNDLNAPLWVGIGSNNRDQPVKYRALANALRRTAKKAGIQKRIYPHLFRHSRATEFANYFTEAQLDSHLGWATGSNMPRMYVHLSEQDADRAMLAMHGIKQEDEKQVLTFQECHICGTKNGPTSVQCSHCGRALDVVEYTNLEERRKQLIMKLTQLISKDTNVNTVFHESLGAV